MKTLLVLALTIMFSIGYSTSANANTRLENKPESNVQVIVKRLKKAILPGFNKPLSKPYSYLTPSSHPNRFKVPFKGGQDRVYINDELSPLATDPFMPEGNLFDFRF